MGDLTKIDSTSSTAHKMIDDAILQIKSSAFLEIVGRDNNFGGAYELLYFATKFIDKNRKDEFSTLLDELYKMEEKAFSESTAYYYVRYELSQL